MRVAWSVFTMLKLRWPSLLLAYFLGLGLWAPLTVPSLGSYLDSATESQTQTNVFSTSAVWAQEFTHFFLETYNEALLAAYQAQEYQVLLDLTQRALAIDNSFSDYHFFQAWALFHLSEQERQDTYRALQEALRLSKWRYRHLYREASFLYARFLLDFQEIQTLRNLFITLPRDVAHSPIFLSYVLNTFISEDEQEREQGRKIWLQFKNFPFSPSYHLLFSTFFDFDRNYVSLILDELPLDFFQQTNDEAIQIFFSSLISDPIFAAQVLPLLIEREFKSIYLQLIQWEGEQNLERMLEWIQLEASLEEIIWSSRFVYMYLYPRLSKRIERRARQNSIIEADLFSPDLNSDQPLIWDSPLRRREYFLRTLTRSLLNRLMKEPEDAWSVRFPTWVFFKEITFKNQILESFSSFFVDSGPVIPYTVFFAPQGGLNSLTIYYEDHMANLAYQRYPYLKEFVIEYKENTQIFQRRYILERYKETFPFFAEHCLQDDWLNFFWCEPTPFSLTEDEAYDRSIAFEDSINGTLAHKIFLFQQRPYFGLINTIKLHNFPKTYEVYNNGELVQQALFGDFQSLETNLGIQSFKILDGLEKPQRILIDTQNDGIADFMEEYHPDKRVQYWDLNFDGYPDVLVQIYTDGLQVYQVVTDPVEKFLQKFPDFSEQLIFPLLEFFQDFNLKNPLPTDSYSSGSSVDRASAS